MRPCRPASPTSILPATRGATRTRRSSATPAWPSPVGRSTISTRTPPLSRRWSRWSLPPALGCSSMPLTTRGGSCSSISSMRRAPSWRLPFRSIAGTALGVIDYINSMPAAAGPWFLSVTLTAGSAPDSFTVLMDDGNGQHFKQFATNSPTALANHNTTSGMSIGAADIATVEDPLATTAPTLETFSSVAGHSVPDDMDFNAGAYATYTGATRAALDAAARWGAFRGRARRLAGCQYVQRCSRRSAGRALPELPWHLGSGPACRRRGCAAPRDQPESDAGRDLHDLRPHGAGHGRPRHARVRRGVRFGHWLWLLSGRTRRPTPSPHTRAQEQPSDWTRWSPAWCTTTTTATAPTIRTSLGSPGGDNAG